MSNHNYSQYSNKKSNSGKAGTAAQAVNKPKNYNKPKVEETIVENVMVHEPETMTVEPTAPEVKMVVETVETATLPKVVTGTVVKCSKLNVRAKPAPDADILTVLDVNSEVVIDTARSTNEWLKITTATGVDGFCMRKFVKR